MVTTLEQFKENVNSVFKDLNYEELEFLSEDECMTAMKKIMAEQDGFDFDKFRDGLEKSGDEKNSVSREAFEANVLKVAAEHNMYTEVVEVKRIAKRVTIPAAR